MSNNMPPYITVVMPVRNEELYIEATLRQVLSQDYPPERFEVIVADGMSNDRTALKVQRIASNDTRVKLLPNPSLLSSAGRNVGFRHGKGEIFLFIDGHCYIPNERLLKNIIECFRSSGASCLGRPQTLDPPGLTDFQGAIAIARSSWLGHSRDSLIYKKYEGYASPVSNGAVYLRRVIDRVGLVDESFDACEDVEFNYRVEKAGFQCYTSNSLAVQYYPRENLLGLIRQMIRYGRGRCRFIFKHPKAFTINQVVLAIFTAYVFFLPVALGWLVIEGLGTVSISMLCGYIIYLFLIASESLRLAARSGWRYLGYLPGIFFSIHIGLGLGLLLETLREATRLIRRYLWKSDTRH